MTESGAPYYVQLGVVQGGFGSCGSEDYPGIYVRTSNEDIMRFIFETTDPGEREEQSVTITSVL